MPLAAFPSRTRYSLLLVLHLLGAAIECSILAGLSRLTGLSIPPAVFAVVVLLGIGTAIYTARTSSRQPPV